MRRVPILVLLALAATGCGSKGAVSLTASVDNAEVTVATVTLGATLSGSFNLHLELGSSAGSALDITPEKFSVFGSNGGVAVEALSAVSDQQPPFHLSPGDRRTIAFTVDDKNPIDATAKAALCAGPVHIGGTVVDANQSTTDVGGSQFSVTGCQ